MNLKKLQLVALWLAILTGTIYTSTNAMTNVMQLKCEYQTNPMGIDIENPRLSWQIASEKLNVMQTAYEIRTAYKKNDLNTQNNIVWNSGKIESDQSVNVVYAGPKTPEKQRVWWQVRIWDQDNNASDWSEAAFWETGLVNSDLWLADWISLPNEKESKESLPVHYYRNEFNLDKEVESARLYASAKGLYEIYLNGEKVGDQLFTPGWTSYKNRIQYQTYDVTEILEKNNALGTMLGEGWYRGYIGFNGQRNYYGDKLALIVQLEIAYKDGSSETIVSDGSWKVSTGPILKSDIYNGELYDANLEKPGWNTVAYNASNWENAMVMDFSKDVLVSPQGESIKAIEELVAVEKITTPKGELVYDLGQNMVGWARLKMYGQKGDVIRIIFAEVLDKEGNFYTANLRSAECTDTYVFGKTGEVIYEPTFTFHGFRFVKIEGLKEALPLENVIGVVIHSDMEQTGTFECNNELINQLQHNIQWGQKGNFLDVPTDCPQRDERLGWTGDAQAFSMTAAYNFDVAPFYTKWMKDVALDQSDNGRVPHVIPDVLNGQGGATGWADAVAIIPWTVYKIYNDKRILEESYPAITKWIAYMKERAGEDYLWTGDSHFGDWLAYATTSSDYPGATTEKDLLATAYFYYTTTLSAKMANILGKTSDEQYYIQMAGNIKDAFIKEFVTPNGRLVSHTQTAYVIALSFDLIPENRVQKAADYLASDVEKFGHLTTGFVGTPLLCHTLSAIGRDDLAYMLLNRKEYPSWLYPVTQGATTIWERWDGQKPDGTFQDVGMNSFNHYAYGAIGEWLYSHVAGIQVDENQPGYKHFMLAPNPGGELYDVKASFKSMYGVIVSNWREQKGILEYHVQIPPNTSATVVLPDANLNEVEMLGELKNLAKQVDKTVCIEVGSGAYDFSYPYKHK